MPPFSKMPRLGNEDWKKVRTDILPNHSTLIKPGEHLSWDRDGEWEIPGTLHIRRHDLPKGSSFDK